MFLLNKMSISKKLLLIPIVGTLSFLIYLLIIMHTSFKNAELLNNIMKVEYPALDLAKETLYELKKVRESLSNAAITGDEETLNVAREMSQLIKDKLVKIQSINASLSRESQVIIDKFNQYFELAFSVSTAMVNNEFDFAKDKQQIELMNTRFSATIQQVEQFSQSRIEGFERSIQSSENNNRDMIEIGIGIAVLTLIIMLGTSIPIVNGLKTNIHQLVKSLKDIAQEDGDLTVRLKTKSKDELGDLVHWFNQFMDKLQGVVKDIVETSSPLSNLADTLHQLTEKTHQVIENQQTSAQKATEAVAQMNQSVNRIADNASVAATSSADAMKVTYEGQDIVKQSVSSIQALDQNIQETELTVKKLDADSSQVGVVLDVIKSIAEQTNLLALNAAIEAARAGDQGRGFAVVADEVRNLASKTQQSTEEIHTTIEQLQAASKSATSGISASSEYASSSVETINQAGDSLEVITGFIIKISEINQSIFELTEQQKQVASFISQSVGDIRERTADTAQSSNQVSELGAELANYAAHLSAVTQQFKV